MQPTLPQIDSPLFNSRQFDFFMDPPDPIPAHNTKPQEKKPKVTPAIVVLYPPQEPKQPSSTKPLRAKNHATPFAATVFELASQTATADIAADVTPDSEGESYYPVDDDADIKRAHRAFALIQEPQQVDPDFALDQELAPDVFSVKKNDTDEIRLAKGMFSRMIYDMMIITVPPKTRTKKSDQEHKQGLDFFGQDQVTTKKADHGDMRKYDALIWMFSLNPGEPLITFEWVCKTLDLCEERIRHVTARNTRKELTQILRYLAGMVDPLYAKYRAEYLSQYINLDNWQAR